VLKRECHLKRGVTLSTNGVKLLFDDCYGEDSISIILSYHVERHKIC
jgi:hypothetical protein